MQVRLHYRALMAAVAFGMMGAGITSCTENIDSPDTDNNQDGLIVSVNAVDTQTEALQAYNANPNSQTYANLLATQGLQGNDLVHGTLPVQGAQADGLMLVESSVPTVNAPAQNAITRGHIASAIDNDFTVAAYRAKTAAEVGEAPVWIPCVTFDKTGKPKQPFRWASKKPYARFYAVFPAASATSGVRMNASEGKVPNVVFKANTDNKAQTDLMVATSPITQYKGDNVVPAVKLPFKHTLTAINFAVGEKLLPNMRITKVTFENVCQEGTYEMASDENGNGGKWTNQGSRTTFTLSGINIPANGAPGNIVLGNGDGFTFLMVPQVLEGKNVKLSIEFNNDPSTTITSTLRGEWKAGETRTYKLANKNVNLDYVFNVKANPATTIFGLNGKVPFEVQSYRTFKGQGHAPQAVAWKVVGYQLENADETWEPVTTNKPDWISFTKSEGNGGFTYEASQVNVTGQTGEMVDALPAYNAQLAKVVPGVTKLGLNKAGQLNTANTYIISHAGQFSLPLIYGSCYQDGKLDKEVYSTFDDYQGHTITEPYIVKQTDQAGSRNRVHIYNSTKLNAKVVWSDPIGAVIFDADQKKNFKDGDDNNPAWLNFTIDQNKIRSGNAVIAVTDKDGKVVWSWQLWFAAENVLEPIPVKGLHKNAKTYYMQAEPLGWTYTKMRQLKGGSKDGRRVKIILEQTIGPKKRASFIVGQNFIEGDGYTMLYQWGRKDPFPSQDIAATKGIVLTTYAPDNYAELIKNPNVYYIQNNNNATPSYFKGRHRIYWDATFNLPTLKIRKTMFDPSPAGYRVPEWEAGAFITGSTTNGEVVNRANNFIFDDRGNTAFVKTNVNDGWLFAPYHFQRDNKTGKLESDWKKSSSVPIYNTFWTLSAKPRSIDGFARYFYGGRKEVGNMHLAPRCYGFGLRPVVDLDYSRTIVPPRRPNT